MKWFVNLKTGTKLAFGFGLCLLLTATISVIALTGLARLDRIANEIAQDSLPGIEGIGQLDSHMIEFRQREYRLLLTSHQAGKQQVESDLRRDMDDIQKEMADYEKTIHQDEDRQNLEHLKTGWAGYLDLHRQLMELSRKNDLKGADALINGRMHQHFQSEVRATLDKMVEWNKHNGERLAKLASDANKSACKQAITLLAMAMVLGITAGWFTTRLIARPLAAISDTAKALAAGDVDQDIRIDTRDEVGELAHSFRSLIAYQKEMAEVAEAMARGDLTRAVEPKGARDVLGNAFASMAENLRQIIRQVSDSADNLGAASEQMAASASQAGQAAGQAAATIQQVAQGTAQQAEAVTKTAVSIEQMSQAIDGVAKGAQEQAGAVSKASAITAQMAAVIQQVAQNAQAGARGATEAARASRSGAQIVRETVEGMESIKIAASLTAEKIQEMSQRSHQIGAIIETIDDIASQTNLLALNAAIEAARAGEHGRGFAVVADEVRKLAERASTATKEIAGLIQGVQQTVAEAVSMMADSSREVEAGAVKAGEAGEALEGILRTAEAVLGQAEEIAAAAQEMAASSHELMSAIETVSAVVEENTASTEEMAAGANEVTQAIESIASVSEQNSAATQEVSAAAEEVTGQAEEVAASAQELARMAQQLQELMARFKIETDREVNVRVQRPSLKRAA